MADESGEKTEEVEAKAKGGKKMMPIIIAAVVALLLGAGLAFKFAGHKGSAKPPPPKVGETLPLDEFMVNLADPSNDHYAKLTIALGLKQGVSSEGFKDKVPVTRDAIVMVLTAKTLDQVRTESGKEKLKSEIKRQVNKALGEDDVLAVYFEAFATQ